MVIILKQRPLERQRDLINELFPKKSWVERILDKTNDTQIITRQIVSFI